MSKRPYQHLPPLEHRPDGSPYRITPPQKRRASGLIRRECCNCEDGNCLALDDGDTCACPQMISFSVCCKWFRWAVLPLDRTLEAEIYRDRDLKRCAECGGVFVPKLYWSSFLVTLCSEIMLYIETPLVSYSYSLNEVSHSCTS